MPRLSVAEQQRLLDALPESRKAHARKVCRECQMKGEGIKDITAKVRRALGPIARELGPTVIKKFIIPMALNKAGLGGIVKGS